MKVTNTEFLRAFNSYKDITPEIIKQFHINGILIDLDDTLVPHNYPVPDESVKLWLEIINKEGIPVCIISNNQKKRMMSFIKDLNVGYFYNSFKPRTHVIDLALGVMNIRRDEAVLIGDQLFTDILAANRSEIKAFLVKPIGNKSTLFIKLKRFIERKILK
jgi:HAD superfamily phosphatase (TIGR01668 family)